MSGSNVGALIDADKAVHEEMRQRYPDGPYQDGMYGTGMLLELGRLGFVVVPTSDWQRLLAATPSVEPLDVERLATAISQYHRRSYIDMIDRLAAESIASTYTALPTQASDSPEKP